MSDHSDSHSAPVPTVVSPDIPPTDPRVVEQPISFGQFPLPSTAFVSPHLSPHTVDLDTPTTTASPSPDSSVRFLAYQVDGDSATATATDSEGEGESESESEGEEGDSEIDAEAAVVGGVFGEAYPESDEESDSEPEPEQPEPELDHPIHIVELSSIGEPKQPIQPQPVHPPIPTTTTTTTPTTTVVPPPAPAPGPRELDIGEMSIPLMGRRRQVDGSGGSGRIEEENEDEQLRLPPTQKGHHQHLHKSSHPYDAGVLDYEFLYHRRVILCLLLCLPQVFRFSTQTMLFLLAFGMMLTYAFNYLRKSLWSFITFHISLGIFLVSLYVHIIYTVFVVGFSLLEVLLMINFFFFVTVVAAYGSIFFGDVLLGAGISAEEAGLVLLVLERWVFAILPICGMPMILHTVVEIQGMRNVGFYAWIVGIGLLLFFGTKLSSSLRSESTGKRQTVHSKIVRIFLLTLSSVVPSMLMLVGDLSLDMDLLALFSKLLSPTWWMVTFPSLFLDVWVFVSASKLVRDWAPVWMDLRLLEDPKKPSRVTSAFRMLFDMAIVALWVETRIIFVRYPHLFNLPFPLNYVFFNLAALAGLVLVSLLLRRTKREQLRSLRQESLGGSASEALGELLRTHEMSATMTAFVAAILAFVICVGISLVLHLSFVMFVFLMMAIVSMASFLSLRHRRAAWLHYVAFVITSAVVLWGWLDENFGYIHLEFVLRFLPFDGITMNIRHVVMLICVLYVLSMLMIIAMKDTERAGNMMNLIVYAHAGLLALVEELLYEQGEGFYSEVLVMLTTVLGTLVVTQSGRVDFFTQNMTLTFLFAKLVILLNNPEHIHAKIPIAAMYTWGMTRVVLLALTKKAKISHTMAWFLVNLLGVSVFFSRLAIWNPLLADVFGIQGSSSRTFGMLLLIWAVSMAPLGFTRLVREKQTPIRRFNVILLVLGFVWGMVEPVVGIPTHFSILVPWLLVATVVLFVGLILKQFRLPRKAALKVLLFALISLGLGLPFVTIFLPHVSVFSWIGVLIMFFCCSMVVLGSHFFTPVRPAGLFYNFFLGSFVLTYLIIPFGLGGFPEFLQSEIIYDARMSLLSCLLVLNLFICVTIRFKLSDRPLIVDHFGDGQPHLIDSVPVSPIVSGDSLLSIIVSFGSVISFVVALFLSRTLDMNTRLAYLISSSVLLLLDFSTAYRYLVVCLVVFGMMMIFFISDMVTLTSQSLHIQSSPLTVMGRTTYHVAAACFSFPAHLYALIYLTCVPDSRPSLGFSIVFVVLAFIGFVLDRLQSVMFFSIWGVIECALLILVAIQWESGSKKKKKRRRRRRLLRKHDRVD